MRAQLTPRCLVLRAGLLDASLRNMTTDEARALILNFMGGLYVERWPDVERQAIFGAHEFSYQQRLDVITFLYGNLRDAELVYAAVQPQLGPAAAAHDHARRFLADLASGKYDDKYHYWRVLHDPAWIELSGAQHVGRAPLCSPHVSRVDAWDAECMRMRREHERWPTLAEQHAYFVGTNI